MPQPKIAPLHGTVSEGGGHHQAVVAEHAYGRCKVDMCNTNRHCLTENEVHKTYKGICIKKCGMLPRMPTTPGCSA